MLNVVRELLGTVVGEIDTIIGAQPPRLSLEVRPLLRIVSLVIDEAVPDIDIVMPAFSARARKARRDNSCR